MEIYKSYDSAANAFIRGFDGKIASISLLEVFTERVPASDTKFIMYGFGTTNNNEDYGYQVVCELLNPRILLNVLASKLYDLNHYNAFNIVERVLRAIDGHNIYLKCSRH